MPSNKDRTYKLQDDFAENKEFITLHVYKADKRVYYPGMNDFHSSSLVFAIQLIYETRGRFFNKKLFLYFEFEYVNLHIGRLEEMTMFFFFSCVYLVVLSFKFFSFPISFSGAVVFVIR